MAKINAIGRSALWTCGVAEDIRNSDNYIIQVSFLRVNASLPVNDPVAMAMALSTIQSRTSSPSYLHAKYINVIVKNRLTPIAVGFFYQERVSTSMFISMCGRNGQ